MGITCIQARPGSVGSLKLVLVGGALAKPIPQYPAVFGPFASTNTVYGFALFDGNNNALFFDSCRAKRRIGVAIFMATCHRILPAHDVDERR